MREIEFRGKLKGTGRWAYGNLNINKAGTTIITPDETLLGIYGKVDPETVGQYTGLKDTNGVKIYEGDITQYIYYKFSNDDFGHKGFYRRTLEVYFNTEELKFTYKLIKAEEIKMPKDYKEAYMEVIGNIYDNPELLDKED